MMTSRERILRTLHRQPVDRVPLSTYELVGFNPDSFENLAPSYRRLMDKIREDTDSFYMWGWEPWADSGLWTRRTETLSDGSTQTHACLRTPRGDLTQTTRSMPGVHTVWTTEHLLKTVEDIDLYLSVMPELYQIDDRKVAAAREDYARAEERVGDHGVVMSNGGDPSYPVAELFEFGAFTLMCYQHRDRILEMIDAFTPPILEHYRITAEEGFGALHRLCGPEYYTPPYLPPECFREMVVPGARAAARLLREGGIFLRLHCHGRIREVLPMILDIGAQGVDPIEPPPDGDITLAEVKARYGADLVLFGNTELKVLETAEPEEVRALVKQQMDAAKAGGGYVMMPTAAPINEPLSPRTERNYFAWIDAGLEYGGYS
jgi:hypothetical protein